MHGFVRSLLMRFPVGTRAYLVAQCLYLSQCPVCTVLVPRTMSPSDVWLFSEATMLGLHRIKYKPHAKPKRNLKIVERLRHM